MTLGRTCINNGNNTSKIHAILQQCAFRKFTTRTATTISSNHAFVANPRDVPRMLPSPRIGHQLQNETAGWNRSHHYRFQSTITNVPESQRQEPQEPLKIIRKDQKMGHSYWRSTTDKLLKISSKGGGENWTPGRLRQAEQCLFHWRTNQCRDSESVVRLWQKLVKENAVSSNNITPHMYAYAVTALSFHAFPRAAQVVLEELYELQQGPFEKQHQQHHQEAHVKQNTDYTNVHLLNDVIHAYAKQKEPEMAEKLLRKAYENNWIMAQDVHSVASALDAWSRVGNGPRAQALLEWVLQQHRQDHPTTPSSGKKALDVAAYNTVLTAWARTEPNNKGGGHNHGHHARGRHRGNSNNNNEMDIPAQRAHQLLEQMEDNPDIQPNAASYSTVIVAWGQSNQQPHGVQQAEAVLGRAHANQCANQICFNAVLHAWAKQGVPQRAFELLEAWLQDVKQQQQQKQKQQQQLETMANDSAPSSFSFSQKDTWPDVTSFNTVIDALAKSGDARAGKQAEALLPWMHDVGIVPDEITCNTILSVYAKSGQVDAAMKLLNRLEQDWEDESSSSLATTSSSAHQGVHPRQRRIAYNTVILAWNNYAEKHCQTIEEKEEAGNKADQILDRMQRHGVIPDSYTYNNTLKTLSVGNMGTAESFLDYMETSNECFVRPDNFTYITLMDAWAKRGHPERAYAILQRMEQSRNHEVYPTVVAYNMIVNAYAKNSDPYAAEEAEAILTKLEQQFEQHYDRNHNRTPFLPSPDLLTYASTISAWSYSPDPNRGPRAWAVLQRMLSNIENAQKSNYRSNHADIIRNAHNMVLAACAGSKGEYRSAAFDIALRTFQMCQENKNHVTYTSFFKCLFHLQDDLPKRHALLADAFLDHCHTSRRRVHKSVISRLERVAPPEVSRAILQKAGVESREWRR